MDQSTISVPSEWLKWIISGAVTVLAAATAAVWRLMNAHVRQWKELYDAKEKDLTSTRNELEEVKKSARIEQEELKKNPTAFAMIVIGNSEAVISAQIAKLEEALRALRAECAAKDREIQELTNQAKQSELHYIAAQESKENFERKIQAYSEIITRLLRRRDLARETLNSYRSGVFEVADLETVISAEVHEQMRQIDSTSFERTMRAEREAHIRAEGRRSLEMKQKLAEREVAENKAQVRNRATLPRPTPDRDHK
jgi:chromosome segregation ATPase